MAWWECHRRPRFLLVDVPLGSKRLGLLRDFVPAATLIAVLLNSDAGRRSIPN